MRATRVIILLAVALAACSSGAEFTAAPAGDVGDAAAPSAAGDAAPARQGLTIDRSALDFGAAPCGSAVAAQALTLRNDGTRDFAYSVFIDDDAAFRLGGATKGGLGPGASAAVTVTPKPIAANAVAGQSIAATLTVTSDDPAHAVQTIALQVTPTGGTLEVSPSTIDFGEVPLEAPPASAPIAVRNTGNAPVTLTIGKVGDASSPFALASASTVTLAAGATFGGAAATFAPTAAGAARADATLSVNGATCGTSAVRIAMRGEGTVGSAEVSPGALDFNVTCAAAAIAAAQSVVVTNRGSAPLVVSNVHVSGPFKLATEATDRRLSPSGVTTIAVVALPAASGDLGGAIKDGTLSFDTTDPAQAHVSLPLRTTIVGANLTFASSSGAPVSTLDFGTVASGAAATQAVRVVNTGNAVASVTPSALAAPFGWSSGAARGVGPGASAAFGVTFAPIAAGRFSAVANVDTVDGVCVAPAALAIAGSASASSPAPAPTPPSAAEDGGHAGTGTPGVDAGVDAGVDGGNAKDGGAGVDAAAMPAPVSVVDAGDGA